ncbi:MAG: class I SAM-dependent methyltransferase [Spirulinaceae cyanobacterium RM2_2_10]|nr:class I SAM-dependent methyltransferase [Spirulinaceae cyanobacterium RM2_2_10]
MGPGLADLLRDRVGEVYLLELSAWHLSSRDYIGDTLRLVGDQAQGRVLDFGGGIGTHTLGAALSPQVQAVVFCDLNPLHREFVTYRAAQLNLTDKITCCEAIAPDESFDTILCFDLLEHLPDPSRQLLAFHNALTPAGKIILNWYFSKGFDQEFPFHLDDPVKVDEFFCTLQHHFLEVFQPYYITARCYRQWRRDH